jgi:hypothetical protein
MSLEDRDWYRAEVKRRSQSTGNPGARPLGVTATSRKRRPALLPMGIAAIVAAIAVVLPVAATTNCGFEGWLSMPEACWRSGWMEIAARVAERVLNEERVAGTELPNVIIPTGSGHAPQGHIVPSRAVRPPRNCTEARSWGLENIPRGSPYYAPWLDGDDDGLACEPWPRRG